MFDIVVLDRNPIRTHSMLTFAVLLECRSPLHPLVPHLASYSFLSGSPFRPCSPRVAACLAFVPWRSSERGAPPVRAAFPPNVSAPPRARPCFYQSQRRSRGVTQDTATSKCRIPTNAAFARKLVIALKVARPRGQVKSASCSPRSAPSKPIKRNANPCVPLVLVTTLRAEVGKKDAKKAYTPANPSRDRGHRGEYIKEVVRSGWKSKTGVDVLGLAATPHTANDALVNAGYSTNIPKRCPLCTTGLLTAPAARSDAGSNPAQLYVRCCANACNARINVLRFCKLPLPIDGKSCSVTPQKVVHYLCTRAKAQYPALPSPTELSRICSIAEEVDQP